MTAVLSYFVVGVAWVSESGSFVHEACVPDACSDFDIPSPSVTLLRLYAVVMLFRGTAAVDLDGFAEQQREGNEWTSPLPCDKAVYEAFTSAHPCATW
jgi:hypothetical protein